MASYIAKKAGKGLLAKHLAGIEPADPLYETVDEGGGQKKRVRRQLPEGLSKRDRKILLKIKKRAHYLDKGMNLCGFRVGWTFWIGIIPGAGDIVNALLNYFLVLRPAKKLELPKWLVHQMLANNAASAAVGFIPLIGDLILAVLKANSRNAHIVEEYLAIRGQEYLASQGHVVPGASNAVRPGVTSGDQDLKNVYKPGAGMKAGEIIPGPGQQPTNTGNGWFGFGGNNQQAQRPVAAQPVQANVIQQPAPAVRR